MKSALKSYGRYSYLDDGHHHHPSSSIICSLYDHTHLKPNSASGVVHTASSEETPEEVDLKGEGEGFSVGFDPLDGSSIIDTNFSVGSIFGIWPGQLLHSVSFHFILTAVLYYTRALLSSPLLPLHIIETPLLMTWPMMYIHIHRQRPSWSYR